VLPASVLDKYRIPYLYSVTDHLKSLAHAEATPHVIAMPGHGSLRDDLAVLIDENRGLVNQVLEAIIDTVTEPQTAEAVLTHVFTSFDAPIFDAPGYYLLQPTIAAFLSHLERQGAIENEIVERRSLWRRA
jgi:hypothetical protein